MKKKLLFGIVGILVLVVAGCGPKTSGGTEPDAPMAAEQEVVEVVSTEKAEASQVGDSQSADSQSADTQSGDTQPADEVEIMYLDDYVFEDAEGNEVRLSDYAGKVVVIDYWATSCGYCIKEMPDLAKLDAEYDDAVILSVSIGDNAGSLQKFIDDSAEDGIVYGHKLLLDTHHSAWDFNVTGTPTKVYVGPNREFIGAVPGAMEYEANKATIEHVFEILDEINVELY